MAAPPPEARPLPSPPVDGITSLSYVPPTSSSSSLLASTSWDGTIRIHDTSSMSCVATRQVDAGPLLSLAATASSASVGGGELVYAGGLDGSIRSFDVGRNEVGLVGYHQGGDGTKEDGNAVSCLCAVGDGLLASAGWDGLFHVWDVRSSSSGGGGGLKLVSTVKLPGKAFGMDSTSAGLGAGVVGRVVVATAGRRTCVIDVRSAGEGDDPASSSSPGGSGGSDVRAEMRLDRESSLKYQTRVVSFFPDGRGLAMGSIEGRVAIEYLHELGLDSEGQKKYAFKCHRVGDTVYPVNAIAFNPKYGTFATGGCDGTVVTWDGRNKKKLATLPKFPTSVAALAYNGDGTQLAIASSYTFEEGEREHPRDEIYVREMLDSECKPKQTSK